MKKVVIDPGCTTCGLCEFIAPDVFEVTDISPVKPTGNYEQYKEDIEELKKDALLNPKQGIIAAIEGMKIRMDREMVLKFSAFKLFYIIGKKDETIPYAQVKAQTTLPNDCEYLILENVGHMGFIEDKEKCFKALKKFAAK